MTEYGDLQTNSPSNDLSPFYFISVPQQNQRIPHKMSWKLRGFSVPSPKKAQYAISSPQLEMVPSCSISSVQVSANGTNTLLA